MAPRQTQQARRNVVATPSITTNASRIAGAGGPGGPTGGGGGGDVGRGGRRAEEGPGRATGSEPRETDAQRRLITAMFERAVDIIQQ